MAKQQNKQVIAAEAEQLFLKHPELQVFANLMRTLIDTRAGTVERLDELIIPVQLISGEEIEVTVPALVNPIVTLTDPRLETFRNIVRLSVAQAPTAYRLGNTMPAQQSQAKQVTAP